MFLTAILSVCGVILLALAAVVIYSNSTAKINRWLSALIVSVFLWLLANLLANITTNQAQNLMFSRAALIGGTLLPFTFLMFCLNFTKRSFGVTKKALIIVPVAALLLTTPTSLNIKSVTSGSLAIQPGISYLFLVLIFVIYFGYGIRLLLREYNQTTQARHQQVYYILLGTFLTLVPGLVFSVILPIFGVATAVSFAPVSALFFAAFTSVAIVRHRLFDVRLVVARSLGYTVSLVGFAALYGFVVFGVARLFFSFRISAVAQIFLALSTGATGLIFERVRKYFDSFTNRLFYQDAYDTRVLFDELNKTLVSSLDIGYLMNASARIIAENLKPAYTLIGLAGATEFRLFGTSVDDIEHAKVDFAKLYGFIEKRKENVVAYDYLDAQTDQALRSLMRKHDVSVVIRLIENNRQAQTSFGYIALGIKRSGNFYTKLDFFTLEAVANDLILAIQNAAHFEEVNDLNLNLQGRVNDATRKLRRTNEKLRALDETKDDFISMASHQLRTPLTSIKGYLSMVLEGDAGKLTPMQKKMLEQSFFSSQRMVYLIADLLNVSRLKTGKFIIESAPVNLAKLVNEEIAQLAETAKSRQLTLDYKQPEDFPELMLDETKVRQVVMNFADNALYYTPPGGHVKVELANKPGSVELRIVDNGLGVPKSEQPHLFTKFYRAENARKARPDGTGLGLFMAKKVVIAQGGAIIFDSTEGKGSTFGFSFAKNRTTDPKHPEVVR